ncbi:hypothetical protein [Rickettsiella endosymbiont of Dermanyssus gallinae]|uniref:hypothetical protein n=1 Tax=Rickettsiella endosymbiont of Dermanyssus gallinae TaxID=2856608 RepID=UPI001C530795|nr:hypothetical protein [Rickettsiella endosymbiont of Dermanyssus gallinae]
MNDSLALIEQRALPALNLTWLNQADINQMELVPEAWLNTNDTFLNKTLYRTKRDGQHHVEKEDAVEDCIMAISNEDLERQEKFGVIL